MPAIINDAIMSSFVYKYVSAFLITGMGKIPGSGITGSRLEVF